MDMGEKDKYDMDNKSEDHMNFSSGMSLDWRFDSSNLPNSSMGLVGKCDLIGTTSCSSAPPMSDSLVSSLWDQPTSYNEGALSALGIKRGGGFNMCWNRGGLLLPSIPGAVPPQSLSQLPADSAFIERAARFSSFNGGAFGDIMNPFVVGPESTGPYSTGRDIFNGLRQRSEINTSEASRDAPVVAEGSPVKKNERRRSESTARSHDEAKQVVGGGSGNESDEEAEFSSGAGAGGGRDEPSMLEETLAKGIGSKKRKRNGQDLDDQAKESTKDKGDEQNPSSTANNKTAAKNGKQGSQQGSDPTKEEYIHVRARRGQATNSHSLAERVRREKISERMKFLQDLVPGCSKVTGKAVMLDEIINYVQSLQRQVEFLSMKLATVNPRLDFNLETLLAKDMLQPRVASSSFAPDMPTASYPSLQTPPHGLILPQGLSGMGNASDILRRTIASSSPLTPLLGGFKEPTQVPNVWEDELNNVIQMSFGTRNSPGSQDVDGSLPSGQMKVEL